MAYRIVDEKFKDDLSGDGAKLYGGRWNPKGSPLLYCSEHISLCMLENMVNMTTGLYRRNFSLIHLQLPLIEIQELNPDALKPDWFEDIDYTRWLGSQFLAQNGFILKVPSAVVPQEFNFIINPMHSHFKKIKISAQYPYHFDDRLFS